MPEPMLLDAPPVDIDSQPLKLMKWTVEQYHDLIDRGMIAEDDGIELLEGLLVEKMGINPPHSLSVGLTNDALQRLLPQNWFTKVQDAFSLVDSEPEPDILVIRGNRRDFGDRHPSPAEVGLVIEVSNTSLLQDRGIKHRIYARAGVPVYWIINLIDRQIEVHSQPTGDLYRLRHLYTEADAVPVTLDGAEVGLLTVRDLLP